MPRLVPASVGLASLIEQENAVPSELQRQVDEFESTVESEQVLFIGILSWNARRWLQ